MESAKSIKDRDMREGEGDIMSQLFLTATCKICMEAREQRERDAAQARRVEAEAKAEARTELEQAELAPAEEVTITLSSKPFGLVASKSEGVAGYVVSKCSEGKPAAVAGVRPGWRLIAVAGADCRDSAHEETTAALKAGEVPLDLVFEKLPGDAAWCTACERALISSLFSRKMLTKPPEKRRCSACVEVAEGAGAEGAGVGAGDDAAPAGPQSQLDELKALCADSAKQAEKVTGLKPVRGGSFAGRGGKGRGRR